MFCKCSFGRDYREIIFVRYKILKREKTAKTFEHNVVWDSIVALTKMSIYMIPLVEILMLLLLYK